MFAADAAAACYTLAAATRDARRAMRRRCRCRFVMPPLRQRYLRLLVSLISAAACRARCAMPPDCHCRLPFMLILPRHARHAYALICRHDISFFFFMRAIFRAYRARCQLRQRRRRLCLITLRR